jgi:uncharacterized protein
MPGDFLDTSALAKHYHPESGSAEIDRLWNSPNQALFVSRLSVLEIVSVFAAEVRAGAISTGDFDALRRRFAADVVKTKRLTGVRLLVAHYKEAERLLRTHGMIRRLRTLDALQLAVAKHLHDKGAINRFVASDRDLLAVAALEGLATFDPEKP